MSFDLKAFMKREKFISAIIIIFVALALVGSVMSYFAK